MPILRPASLLARAYAMRMCVALVSACIVLASCGGDNHRAPANPGTPPTLTVMASAPVLTITQQPADTSVVAGAMATFGVAATCSSGTLGVQWQRSQGGGAFANIAGATAATYSFSSVVGDSGATFRAALD